MKYKTQEGDEVEGTPTEIAEFLSLKKRSPAPAAPTAKRLVAPKVMTDKEREERNAERRRLYQRNRYHLLAKKRVKHHTNYKQFLGGKSLGQVLDSMSDIENTDVDEIIERVRGLGVPAAISNRKLKIGVKAYIYAKKRAAKAAEPDKPAEQPQQKPGGLFSGVI